MSLYNTKNSKRLYLSAEETLAENNTQNCILEEGRLMARQGIFARPEDWLFDNLSNLVAEMSLIVTDCFLYVDGKYCRVAVSVSDNEIANVDYSMRLVFADGSVREIGTISFGRVTEEIFGVPKSFTVFSGTPTKGCGIYFISRQVYENDLPDFVRVLELNTEMTNWYPVLDSEIYRPIILANGRGDSYHLALYEGEGLKLKEPVRMESRNLLGEGFRCYFTADSASSAFTLPYSSLSEGVVFVDYLQNGATYSFKIERGKSESEEVKVGDLSVKIICDRAAGRIHFKRSDGTSWEPPYTGSYNNIKISAGKAFTQDKIKVAAMSACCGAGETAGNGASEVTVFYKNGISPGTVIFNSSKNPLYFPEDSLQILGESQLEVVGMLVKDSRLLAFKENEIYSADTQNPGKGGEEEPSKEGEKSLSSTGGILFKRVGSLEAAPCEKTFAVLSGDIFYTSRRGDIIRIYGSGSSQKVEKIGRANIENPLNLFAVIDRGRYLIIEGTGCLAVQKTENRYRFFNWTLPERMVHGFTYLNRAVLFAALEDDPTYFVYPVTFYGNEDRIMVAEGTARRLETLPLAAEYSPVIHKGQPQRIRLLEVRLDGNPTGAEQVLADGNTRKLRIRHNEGRINTGFASGKEDLIFRFPGDFFLDGIAVSYRSLSKL
ncbi:MAG: hypothetical protein UIG59_08250 [Acutalibacteraceae bacterium]|nr:hypothetical protein [Acutalibacteraceae bacterium]